MKKLGFDLIILGDSTSGKDTQALILAKKYKVSLAGSGEYLRKFRPKQYIQGEAASTKIILTFLKNSVKKIKPDQNLVFVGAARLKPEAEYLVKILKEQKRDFFAIYLRLPKEEIIKRSFLRSERPEDSDLALINKRLKYYKELVSKTVTYYKGLKKLHFINSNQSISKVARDIQKTINDYQRSKRG
jgi:adenylate kinase family enzyme